MMLIMDNQAKTYVTMSFALHDSMMASSFQSITTLSTPVVCGLRELIIRKLQPYPVNHLLLFLVITCLISNHVGKLFRFSLFN